MNAPHGGALSVPRLSRRAESLGTENAFVVLAEVNRLLERLCTLTSQPRGEGREVLLSLAFVLSPTDRRAKRRGQGE